MSPVTGWPIPMRMRARFNGNSAPRTDLKSLRARLWTLASRLAQRNGLSDLVQPVAGRGLGFVLRRSPIRRSSTSSTRIPWPRYRWCGGTWPRAPELTVARSTRCSRPCRRIRSAPRAGRPGCGTALRQRLDARPGHMGYRLWRRLDDRDWQDLLALMDTYRALRRTAAPDDGTLWSCG